MLSGAILGVLYIITRLVNEPTIFQIALIGLVLTIFSIGWSWVVRQYLYQRITKVIDATDRAAEGDFTIQLEAQQTDKVGQLSLAFNHLMSNFNNLQQSRNLLSRTMSPAVRQYLTENGLDFRGLVKTVSILFIDIRGFTQITESHDSEQLVFFLNDYYTTIANQVHIEGGIIGKYGGDSILAFFGAPHSQAPADTSVGALLTALALQEAIHDLSERWKFLGMPPIRVGIGIGIGSVVAGPVGSEDQFEYTVIGDAVNLASRLQDLTRNLDGFNIILAAEVYEALDAGIKQQIRVINLERYQTQAQQSHLAPPIQFVDIGEVIVKGKKEPIQVYALPDNEADSGPFEHSS